MLRAKTREAPRYIPFQDGGPHRGAVVGTEISCRLHGVGRHWFVTPWPARTRPLAEVDRPALVFSSVSAPSISSRTRYPAAVRGTGGKVGGIAVPGSRRRFAVPRQVHVVVDVVEVGVPEECVSPVRSNLLVSHDAWVLLVHASSMPVGAPG